MCKQNPHIVHTCIYNRDCWQTNCPSTADLFCDWFNPLSHHGWVEVYMFIVVKFYNRYSTILSTMSNMHALPFNGCDQYLNSIWTTQLKMWQGKAWACLSYTIHTGNRSRAVLVGGSPACEEAVLERGTC
jgi:hypothetical protein